ncbi:MAG: CBS domain-containing protein, partial [Nitrososphaerales archaeon]
EGFPIVSGSEFIGYVMAKEVKHAAKKAAPETTTARTIMIPKEEVVTIPETETAMKAVQLVNASQIGRVFVVDDEGRLSGIITRVDIIKKVQSEQSLFEGKGYASSREHVISVDRGMMFELESPEGSGWSASYNNAEFTLVDQRILQLSDGRQVKQLTFQPLQSGKFSIALTQSPSQTPSDEWTSKRVQNRADHTVIVN